MTLPEVSTVRFIEPRVIPVARATDLGSVQVLKHGNIYQLTDPFGDIHPDSRGLGIYHGDTRILSCSILRVGGARPVLLQGSMGGNYRGRIQLTNPSADRNPDAKVHPLDDLVGRTISIARDRLIARDALEERVRIASHSSRPERITLELELGYDGADIFEVRGYPRPARGTLLPVAVTADRVTFRYDGLDGVRRSTHVAFSEPSTRVDAVDPASEPVDAGAVVRLHWELDLEPGATGSVDWTVWSSEAPTPAGTDGTAAVAREAREVDVAALFPEPPNVSGDEGAAAYHAWERGTTAVDSDHDLFNLVIKRSVADLRLLVNEGPGPNQRYVAAGVPWFATLFGRDAIISAIQSIAFRPQLAVETLSVLAAYQAVDIDDWRDAEPGKILHEIRAGEMAHSGELPHTPYYGSVEFDAPVAHPAGHDLRLDRRPGAPRPAVAERHGRP